MSPTWKLLEDVLSFGFVTLPVEDVFSVDRDSNRAHHAASRIAPRLPIRFRFSGRDGRDVRQGSRAAHRICDEYLGARSSCGRPDIVDEPVFDALSIGTTRLQSDARQSHRTANTVPGSAPPQEV